MTKTERYISRVQDHCTFDLQGDQADCFDFITEQMAVWEERRAAFIRKVDAGGDPGDVTIFDYEETLLALQAEQAKYSPLNRIDATELNANVARLQQTVEAM